MGFEEHSRKIFPFKVLYVQTDNGTEFAYKYISDKEKCPFEKRLSDSGIEHRQIKPRNHGIMGRLKGVTGWIGGTFTNGKHSKSMEGYNEKLKKHLDWTNNRPMRIFKAKAPWKSLWIMHGSYDCKKFAGSVGKGVTHASRKSCHGFGYATFNPSH